MNIRSLVCSLALLSGATTGVSSCAVAKTLVSPVTGPALYVRESARGDVDAGRVLLWLHAVPLLMVGSPFVGLYNGLRSDYYATRKPLGVNTACVVPSR